MGQRHQIYLFVRERKGFDNKPGKRLGFGIHHQWLYGHTAGLQAIRMMEFQAVASKQSYHPLNGTAIFNGSEPRDILKAVYSVIPEEGYFHDVIELGEWEKKQLKDPGTGDNNDGITVFDFTDPEKPTYFMMNIFEQDRTYDGNVSVLPSLQPVSVEEYVRAYYPVGGTEYQKENWNKSTFAKNERHLKKIFKRASKFSVMTLERAKKLFPAMYRDAEELKIIKASGWDLTKPLSKAKRKEILANAKA